MQTEEQGVTPTSEATPEQVIAETQSPSLEESIRQQLDYAFDLTPPQEETPAITDGSEPVTGEVLTTPEAAAEIPTTPTVFDENAFFQEFGVASKDELKARLQEIETLRATPQTAEEIAFANEETKKIYQYLREGKVKEVKQYLDGQELLSSFESMNDEQKLKSHIKMTYPKFTQAMVEHEYNKRYGIKEADDYDDPLEYEMDKLKAESRMEEDARKAVESFAQYRQKIELPDIQPIQQPTDEAYEAYKASIAEADKAHQEVIVPAINSLKETDLGVSFKVSDPQNLMNFDVSVAVEKSDMDAIKAHALNYNEYMQKTFYDDKGNFNAKRFAQAILRDQKFDSYVQTAARQGAMAERRRMITKETPESTLQRQQVVPAGEKSELQKRLDEAYAGF